MGVVHIGQSPPSVYHALYTLNIFFLKGISKIMTERKMIQLLELWKKRLGLESWKINLKFGPCSHDWYYMEVRYSQNYQKARITIPPWIMGKGKPPIELIQDVTDKMREECLVHELLHICTRDLVNIVDDDINGMIHRDAHSILKESMSRADERLVDGLAVALVRAFRKDI